MSGSCFFCGWTDSGNLSGVQGVLEDQSTGKDQMIPVQTASGGNSEGFLAQLVEDLEVFERGLSVIATAVPLSGSIQVDVLAHDLDGRVVLLLAENGAGGPLLDRAARALVSYRDRIPLIARLLPDAKFDLQEMPRLILVARRIDEESEQLISLLIAPDTRIFEFMEIEEDGASRLVLSGRNEILPSAALSESGDRLENAAENGDAHRGENLPATDSVITQVDGNGTAANPFFQELKGRLLRLSPDISEEEGVDASYYRLFGKTLAVMQPDECQVRVSIGRGEESVFQVRDQHSLGIALDLVFETFLRLTAKEVGSTETQVAGSGSRESSEPPPSRRGRKSKP